jgi:repressor LexA
MEMELPSLPAGQGSSAQGCGTPSSVLAFIVVAYCTNGLVLMCLVQTGECQLRVGASPDRLSLYGVGRRCDEGGGRMALTARQERILEFISVHCRVYGRSPTQREIADEVGYRSIGGLGYQIRELDRLGYLRRVPKRARTLEVVEDSADLPVAGPPPYTEEAVLVPVRGRIAAGQPLLAEQNIESIFPLPRRIVGFGEVFLLEVQGDSMLYEAILDGDWVTIRSQPTANDGQIVAALIRNETTGENEATVKVLRRHKGRIWLEPRNAGYPQIPGDEATIIGIVVAVLRRVDATKSP